MSIPYALILNGVVDNIVLWDGQTDWSPLSSNGTPYDSAPIPLVVNKVAVVDANNNSVQEQATYVNGVFTNPAAPTPKAIPVPVIISPNVLNVKVGQEFFYQITATNSPTSFGVTPLQNGFILDAQLGLLSGIPMGPGTGQLTISATNDGGTGTMILTGTAS